MSRSLGLKLFDDVLAYSRYKTHRTGTSDDQQTIEWFAGCLGDDHAAVVIDPWTFPQWIAEWSATVDGDEIESLPLFYETVGSFGPDEIHIQPTMHVHGFLTVKNRRAVSVVEPVARPTLQVASKYAGCGDTIRAHINNARIVEGHSANVLATYGCSLDTADLLIATPLSGWFTCASERGTGIAVARWLARTLAERGVRVALLATSGHELFNLGLEHHLGQQQARPSAIVHIGASVGAVSDQLFAISNQTDSTTALSHVGFRPMVSTTDPKGWIGEGTRWCSLSSPLLSVAGVSDWFHTPQDTPEFATNPERLELVTIALLTDVFELLDRLKV